MIKKVSDIRTLIIINLGLLGVCTVVLIALKKLAEAQSFLIGAIFGLINLFLLAFIAQKLFKSGGSGITIFLVIAKYSILGFGLYFLVENATISLPWLIFGLSIFFPSVIIYGFLLAKNQSGLTERSKQ